MQNLLSVLGPALAAMASVLGIVLAVEQLTVASRLRRTARLARELAEPESDEERRKVLQSVHEVAVARLVAGWLVPGWQFIPALVFALSGPAVVGIGVAVDTLNLDISGFSVATAGFVLCAFGARTCIGLIVVRQRAAREYLSGSTSTLTRSVLIEPRGGTKLDLLGACIGLGGVVLATGIGGLLHDPENVKLWHVVAIGLGPGLAAPAIAILHSWAPRPLETPE